MGTRSARARTFPPGVVAVAVFAVGAAACSVTVFDDERVDGSGEVRTEVRVVDDYDRIVLAGEGRVEFGTGTAGEIEIETDRNLLGYIETEVDDQTLTIRTESGVDIDPTRGVTYRLACPEIAEARLSGAGSIDLGDCTGPDELELTLTGAGSLRAVSLEAASLEASLPGAGSIEVEGIVDRLRVKVSGAGDFGGADLRATEATIESSGVGEAVLWVVEELDVEISGVGEVRYHGEPTVTSSVSGLGSIQGLGPK